MKTGKRNGTKRAPRNTAWSEILGRPTLIVPTLQDAIELGRHWAAEDEVDEDDGGQDASLAFLGFKANGEYRPVLYELLKQRVVGGQNDKWAEKRSRPLRSKWVREQFIEPLPEWAQ